MNHRQMSGWGICNSKYYIAIEYVMLKKAMREDSKYLTILSIDLGLEFGLTLPESLADSIITKEYEENGLFLTANNALYRKYIFYQCCITK